MVISIFSNLLNYCFFLTILKKKCANSFRYGLTCFLLAGCGGSEPDQSTAETDPAIVVTFMVAEPVNMPMSLETIAQTEGAKEIEVRPRVGGILLKRLYDEGTAVEAGQPLFLIDPEPFQNALNEARALLREQEARVLRARTDESRQKRLLAENFVSQRAHELAAMDLAIEEAALQAAKVRVQQAQLNLSYTTVKAPVSGVTGRSQFSEGALVSANGSLLTTLAQLSPIWVRFSFSDNEVARFGGHLSEKNVHSVRMILADGSDYQREGKINFAASKIDPTLGTQQLRATFENADQRILPGQFVRVRVIAGESRTVYIVPQVAVLSSDLGRFVYVIDEDNAVGQRAVIAGDWIGKDWIILDGLNAEDRVVIDNLIKLSPGKTVDPQIRDAVSTSHFNASS
ncbi:efflux RND transporter periplasmic adaptor subunit [Nitrosomonas ureae]|uniref:Membrane fusion protein, multidrug efflux system n=1 Tax=Nitrosomonas ureae TaxID=44577 RepID=A0A1H5TAL1_9PROT|nr:efflux RND transporter periplasmic adaptor subunit [Nitrosomonas ureae]SEF59865.1 membrane fusion protein, multidrug efflux system [Nitrosomonas ureae]